MTPTTEQKIKQYEDFLHKLSILVVAGSHEGIRRLVANADDWSYSWRRGNGELSEEQQQELIDKAFWKLNDLGDEKN